jgi:hypothetical protein
LCPEESLRRFEEEEIFLADVIAACEKCELDRGKDILVPGRKRVANKEAFRYR